MIWIVLWEAIHIEDYKTRHLVPGKESRSQKESIFLCIWFFCAWQRRDEVNGSPSQSLRIFSREFHFFVHGLFARRKWAQGFRFDTLNNSKFQNVGVRFLSHSWGRSKLFRSSAIKASEWVTEPFLNAGIHLCPQVVSFLAEVTRPSWDKSFCSWVSLTCVVWLSCKTKRNLFLGSLFLNGRKRRMGRGREGKSVVSQFLCIVSIRVTFECGRDESNPRQEKCGGLCRGAMSLLLRIHSCTRKGSNFPSGVFFPPCSGSLDNFLLGAKLPRLTLHFLRKTAWLWVRNPVAFLRVKSICVYAAAFFPKSHSPDFPARDPPPSCTSPPILLIAPCTPVVFWTMFSHLPY